MTDKTLDMRLIFGPIVWNNLDYLLFIGKLTRDNFDYYVNFMLEHFVVCDECVQHAREFLALDRSHHNWNLLSLIVSFHNWATIHASKHRWLNPVMRTTNDYINYLAKKFTHHITITHDDLTTPWTSTCLTSES